ncbi:hypothetical protein [Enterococcus dongliensis]|uniref:Uncharacterized protein n=3 Tax=Enterococcus dongliensis TaxID=2559925 RepID=A0AAP5U1X5_9ENTE|nr:hypothetical protein [Enterococcus dongliensis]MDT2595417.1 hypothetical protein [Enterococcus dongliensis]MDT2603369.1 hypothetical protein [Enterococcus dongliensis]MDT2633730.1 hypothetical protein [Enterococcus dongliensis]MDT2635896.1 hypothetical protein [Enterococcus dongliensis]MDT2644105.1 hypothetical protein [Enterococcus dongliensis]
MIETFVFSSEDIFLKEDQTNIQQLLEYLKSRKQQIGMVFYDQEKMNQILLNDHLTDYLDFTIKGKETEIIPQELVDFLQVELTYQKVNYISDSLEKVKKAEEFGFKSIYLAENCYKKTVTCQAFQDFEQLHLGVIENRFDTLM